MCTHYLEDGHLGWKLGTLKTINAEDSYLFVNVIVFPDLKENMDWNNSYDQKFAYILTKSADV